MTEHDNGVDLRERLDYAMHDLSAPDHLTESVLTAGRRLRRRRRIVAGGAGVAGAAVVTAVVVASLSSGPTSAGTDVATEPPAPKSSEKPITGVPSAGPADPDDAFPELPEGWWDVPSTDMVEILEGLLPVGVTLVEAETRVETGDPNDPWDPAFGGLHGILDGPTGPGSFQIILYAPDASTSDGLEPTPGAATLRSRIKCRTYHDNCEPITNADGRQIGRVSTDVERGTTYFDVALLGPDGGALYFAVMDSTGEKPGYAPSTAETPPLTLAQLRELAENPVWTSYEP